MSAEIDADLAAIEATVRTYLDGLYEGDADKLAAAFHPTSALAQSVDGEIKIVPREQWLAAVRTRPSPKAQGLARHDRIVSIDRVGPTMAAVKVQCAIPPRFFVDLLSLLKIDGRWQIAQKVFQTETRAG
ncbi:MAG: nuclear transport factor 2 family protein [Azospirillum sp.]|nr:nuclear transport factor 2 family protein [Azospirillum sp.]